MHQVPLFNDNWPASQKENNTTLRTRPETDDANTSDDKYPLNDLLRDLLKWVNDHHQNGRIVWPSYIKSKPDLVVVDPSHRLGYGIFGRRDTDLIIADTSRKTRLTTLVKVADFSR